ncbi:MAG TPA: DUF5329 family protein [Candidatus Omnitrophota bacterium]|nr:DUF5329 family protein [Candidatus Omnitrophota bacterium]
MKQTGFVILILILSGCALTQKSSLKDLSKHCSPACLSAAEEIPAIVRVFLETRDLTTEEGKIDYLIARVKDSNLIFIRNKVRYTGTQAAQFLRWKLNRWRTRYHMKIESAQDFVSVVTSGSRTSGKPYKVVFDDGTHYDLELVLQSELNALNTSIRNELAHRQDESNTEPSSIVSVS